MLPTQHWHAPAGVHDAFPMTHALHDAGDTSSAIACLEEALRLVREAGGQIRVESAPGAGTTFWILFPEEA